MRFFIYGVIIIAAFAATRSEAFSFSPPYCAAPNVSQASVSGTACNTPEACAAAYFAAYPTYTMGSGSTEWSVTHTYDYVVRVWSNNVVASYTRNLSPAGTNTSSPQSNAGYEQTITPSWTCAPAPDPDPNDCAEKQGTEESFTSLTENTVGACVAGCVVGRGSGARIQVQLVGSPEIYTSGEYTGGTCDGSASDYVASEGIKVEVIDGVTSFSDGSKTVKLPSSTDGSNGSLGSQAAALNPTVAMDVVTSDLTGGSDTVENDTPITNSTTYNITNIAHTGTGQAGSATVKVGQAGSGTGTGGTGGTGGGNSPSNTDAINCPNGYIAWDDGTNVSCIGSIPDTGTTGGEGEGEGESVAFEGDEVGTFGAMTGAFYDRIKQTPLLGMGDGITFGGGSCPSITINTGLIGTISTAQHCEIFNLVKPALSSVMLLLFSFIGIRIILSA